MRNVRLRALFSTLAAVLIAATLTVSLTSIAAPAGSSVPDLPPELKDRFELKTDTSAGKMVLIDFYSRSCGVCRQMEPHLEALKKMAGSKVAFERLDISDEENRKFEMLFELDGTPTYIMFDRDGKPVYRMNDRISSVVLTMQVLRFSDQLDHTPIPAAIPALNREAATDLRLISFGGPDCVKCKKDDALLSGFALADEANLAVVNLDTAQPEIRKFMKQIKVSQTPSYVLMDKENRVVLRLEGPIETADAARQLWDMIRDFNNRGL